VVPARVQFYNQQEERAYKWESEKARGVKAKSKKKTTTTTTKRRNVPCRRGNSRAQT
jgi:hypothetical protein